MNFQHNAIQLRIKPIYLLGFIISTLLVAIAFFLEFYRQLNPCPLCVLQRFSFLGLSMLCLLGLLIYRQRTLSLIINMLTILFSILGMVIAGRQVWLQYFAPSHSLHECGASISYLMQVLPLHEVIQKLFESSAECGEKGFTILFLSLASWSLIWFTLFMLGSIYLLFLSLRRR